VPEAYREHLGAQVYGCDICQDVCPWNRGIEKRRQDDPPRGNTEPHVSLLDWLQADDRELSTRYDRLFVPRNDARWLKRNALVAAGNVGGDAERAALQPYLEGDDALLREHAAWAAARIEARA
jgi:epoxyqueuosine reductase